MGASLKAKPNNRKRFLLAVMALLLVVFITFPLIAEAAPSPTANSEKTTEPSATPIPEPAITEITIQKEGNRQWWIVYPPDGQKVAFESVANYHFSQDPYFASLYVTDDKNNYLPVNYLDAEEYMHSKGYWKESDDEEAEKGFWDKVIGFLKDIWQGLKDAVNILGLIWEAILTGQLLSLLVAALITIIGNGNSDLVLNIINYADSTETLFQLPIGQILVGFSQKFGFMLWIIGFIIATAEIIINHKSNHLIGDSLHDYTINTFKSFLAVIFFTVLPVPLFLFVTEIATIICSPILESGVYAGKIDFNNLHWDMTPSDLMVLIFFIALLFAGLKVLFSFIKRGGILMILILVGSVHMINLPRGHWDSFWSWCRQIIALCVTQFCQMALFCTGIAVFSASHQTSFALFLVGLSLTLAAAEVPRIAERYGMDTSFKGNAAGAVQTITTVARMVILKK